jgi:hypothetical protein
MGISGWDAVPGDAERGLVGELARAILLAAVFRRDRSTVSEDGAAMEQDRRRNPLFEGFIPAFLAAELDPA